MIILGILVGLLVLMILITLHELGHFIAARRNGVHVEEFAIGFPPRGIAWQKIGGKWRRLKKYQWDNPPNNNLIISLNWLPIGGFCRLRGESDAATAKGSFGQASFWSKTKILFAGVAMNLAAAIVVLTILAWTGMPHFVNDQFQMPTDTRIATSPVIVEAIEPDSPAAKAGFQVGDQIKTMRIQQCVIEGCMDVQDETVNVLTPDSVSNFDEEYAGRAIEVTLVRDDVEEIVPVQLNHADDGEYLLGVTMKQDHQPLYRATWSAPIVGVATTFQLVGETFRGVGTMIVDAVSGLFMQINPDGAVREQGAANLERAGQGVSGPIGIVGVIFPAFAQAGFANLAFLAAVISISLACMNILPIPALDGGRWLVIAIYRLRRKKLSRETEEKIIGRSFLVLLGLILLITVLDIFRIFGN